MSNAWDFEAFREYVIGHAKRSGKASDQASLSKITGISTGLLGRYFRGEVQPAEKNLLRIAETIPGTTYPHLQVLAGRATPDQVGLAAGAEVTPPPPVHPLAERVNHLLGDDSPLTDGERDLLATLLERVLDPYSNGARRRTA